MAPLLNENKTKTMCKKHIGGRDKYQKSWKCQKLVCLLYNPNLVYLCSLQLLF